jgi:hypothetical protein
MQCYEDEQNLSREVDALSTPYFLVYHDRLTQVTLFETFPYSKQNAKNTCKHQTHKNIRKQQKNPYMDLLIF